VNNTVQTELLVRFTPELWNTTALQAAAKASHASIGATVKTDYQELGLPGLQLVQLPVGMTVNESIAYYTSLPYVKYAEPNVVYTIQNKDGQQGGVSGAADPNRMSINNSSSLPVRLLVQFNVKSLPDEANRSAYAKQVHASLNATLIKDFTKDGLAGLQLVELPAHMTASEGMSAYKNMTAVVFAQPDYTIFIDDTGATKKV
jgi:hypothetical protein